MMIKRNVRERILQTGSALMHYTGYNDTGIKEITDAAGIPKGSFYNYFKSKEQFAISALDYMSRQTLRRIHSNLGDQTKPPLERIIEFFTEMVEKNIRDLNFKKGCFIGNLCQEMADVNTPIGKKIDDIFRNYTAALSRCLDEAQKKGDIRTDYDVDTLAEFIFNSWEGALMRMKASRNAQPLTAFMDILTGVLLR
jgi:TetR/AcrR family transcriptional repressor of nem operon